MSGRSQPVENGRLLLLAHSHNGTRQSKLRCNLDVVGPNNAPGSMRVIVDVR
jgi:hypothetical protein